MKNQLLVFSLLATLSSLAATITDVTVSPRWPWEDKVDIDFTLDSATHGAYPVTVKLYDGETALAVSAESIAGNGNPRGPGRHHFVFDFAASGLESRPKALRAVVTTTETSVRYMIIDLTKRPGEDGQCEYVCVGDERLTTVQDFPIEYAVSDDPSDGTKTTHIDYQDVWFSMTNDTIYATSKMVFRYVPPQVDVKTGEGNVAESASLVTLSKAYWMSVYPLTQGQYSYLKWDVPNRRHKDPNYGTSTISLDVQQRPMQGGANNYVETKYTDDPYDDYMSGMRGSVDDQVGWPIHGHAVAATSTLALFREKTGLRLDYPTEAQWEVACRAGTTGYYYDKESTAQNTNLLYRFASKVAPGVADRTPVGGAGRLPNAWGFYDMIGYYGEVTLDRYSTTRISGVNPVGPADPDQMAKDRVVRGVSSHKEPDAQTTHVGSRCSAGYAGGQYYYPNLTTIRLTVEID